jgi:AcrR family transcriptional regulator
MSKAHHRPKAPDAVRANLINAAADLLAHGETLSMSTVAERAGVTKGAVQHHFGTRDAMLDAMFAAHLNDFEQDLAARAAQDGAPGHAARAYVNATVENAGPAHEPMAWRALLVAAVIDRPIAERWSHWVAGRRREDRAPGSQELIMRLAADGLWLSDLLGVYDLSAKERAELQEALLALSPGKMASRTPASTRVTPKKLTPAKTTSRKDT